MTPSFYIEATKELVLVKPNGTMEFYPESGDLLGNSIQFMSEVAAITYAHDRGWREVALPL